MWFSFGLSLLVDLQLINYYELTLVHSFLRKVVLSAF